MPSVKLPPELKARIEAGAAKRADDHLWEGPSSAGPNGGVTQSMIVRFLTCPERFRITHVLGLKPTERWNHRTGYGNMWHVCEEAIAKQRSGLEAIGGPRFDFAEDGWANPLRGHCQKMCRQFPFQQEEIQHWWQICRLQFPLCVEHWAKHRETVERTPLLQEQVFDVGYKLPSGRTVRLRGKWDAVDLIGKGKAAGLWIQDHKTKGDIDEQAIKTQMTGDLQLMTYLVALERFDWTKNRDVFSDPAINVFKGLPPIKGVRYNVVRRPLSGGKGTIVQGKGTRGAKCGKCKGAGKLITTIPPYGCPCPKCAGEGRIGAKPPESKESFYARVAQVIRDEPEHYFYRWTASVLPGDVERFKKETLDPILERLCDWWQWINSVRGRADPFADGGGRGLHWKHPYGCDNAVNEWGTTDVDEYCNTGSAVGLKRKERLFEEL